MWSELGIQEVGWILNTDLVLLNCWSSFYSDIHITWPPWSLSLGNPSILCLERTLQNLPRQKTGPNGPFNGPWWQCLWSQHSGWWSCEFQVSQSYIERPCLKQTETHKWSGKRPIYTYESSLIIRPFRMWVFPS